MIPDPYRLEEPALGRLAGEPRATARPNAARAMCLMTNGTWLLAHVRAWARLDGDQWAVLIGWSIAGSYREQWFVHDPSRVKPVAPGSRFPGSRALFFSLGNPWGGTPGRRPPQLNGTNAVPRTH